MKRNEFRYALVESDTMDISHKKPYTELELPVAHSYTVQKEPARNSKN